MDKLNSCYWLLHTVSNPGEQRMKSRGYIKEWLSFNCHILLKKNNNKKTLCWFSFSLRTNLKWQTLICSVWANQRSGNQHTPEQFSQSAPGLLSSACLPSLLLSYFLFLGFCLLISLLIMPSGIQLHGSDKHGAPLCLSFSLSFSQMELWFNRHDSTGTRLPASENKQTNQ